MSLVNRLAILCAVFAATGARADGDAGIPARDVVVEARIGDHWSSPGKFNRLMGSYGLPRVFASGPELGVTAMVFGERTAFGVTTLHVQNDANTVDPWVGAMIHDGFLVNYGPLLGSGRRHREFVLGGFGFATGRMMLQLNSNPPLEATLRDPRRGVELEQTVMLLHLGAGAQRWWMTPSFVPGLRRWGLGLGAGYILGVLPDSWSTSQPWEVKGTPFGITGPYAELKLIVG